MGSWIKRSQAAIPYGQFRSQLRKILKVWKHLYERSCADKTHKTQAGAEMRMAGLENAFGVVKVLDKPCTNNSISAVQHLTTRGH